MNNNSILVALFLSIIASYNIIKNCEDNQSTFFGYMQKDYQHFIL